MQEDDDSAWKDTSFTSDGRASSAKQREELTTFRVLDQASIDAKWVGHMNEFAANLSVSTDVADCLLRSILYDSDTQERILLDPTVRAKFIQAAGIVSPAVTDYTLTSIVCGAACSDEPVPIADAHALSCGHWVCNDCWRGQLASDVDHGNEAIFSRCPTITTLHGKTVRCPNPVDFTTSQQFLSAAHLDKLCGWLRNQYIDGLGSMKRCPAPRCGRIVELEGDELRINCVCKHSWCFKCCGATHSPCPCDLAQKWALICGDGDSKSMQYLKLNAKNCPRCKASIMKELDCNHVKCTRCQYDFCWQCLEEMKIGKDHPSWYSCKVEEARVLSGRISEDEKQRQSLAAQLQRTQQWAPRIEAAQRDRRSALRCLGPPGGVQRVDRESVVVRG